MPAAEKTVPGSPRGDGEETGTVGTEDDRSGGRTAGEIWKDAPVWTGRGGSQEMDGARRIAAAEQTAQTEEATQTTLGGDSVLAGLERAAQVGMISPALVRAKQSGSAQTGLEGLYRQTVRGLRPAAPALPPEQAGRTTRAQEPGSTASLAVDELDRAVRRDSRRYDGGMSIY